MYKLEVSLPYANRLHAFPFISYVAGVFLTTVNQLKFDIFPVKLNTTEAVRNRIVDAMHVLTACCFFLAKNVATEISEQLCDSVSKKLEGKVLGTFTGNLVLP